MFEEVVNARGRNRRRVSEIELGQNHSYLRLNYVNLSRFDRRLNKQGVSSNGLDEAATDIRLPTHFVKKLFC